MFTRHKKGPIVIILVITALDRNYDKLVFTMNRYIKSKVSPNRTLWLVILGITSGYIFSETFLQPDQNRLYFLLSTFSSLKSRCGKYSDQILDIDKVQKSHYPDTKYLKNNSPTVLSTQKTSDDKNVRFKNNPPQPIIVPKKFIYIGVISTSSNLATRGIALYQTWGKFIASIGGRLDFYIGEKNAEKISDEARKLLHKHIIKLRSVDDTKYPPQKKSLLMLKTMWQKHGKKYQWFMRADDDVYRVFLLVVILFFDIVSKNKFSLFTAFFIRHEKNTLFLYQTRKLGKIPQIPKQHQTALTRTNWSR